MGTLKGKGKLILSTKRMVLINNALDTENEYDSEEDDIPKLRAFEIPLYLIKENKLVK